MSCMICWKVHCNMKFLLQHVIWKKFISYSSLAKSLEGLELGYMEADNKPRYIFWVTLNSTDRSLGEKGNTDFDQTLLT